MQTMKNLKFRAWDKQLKHFKYFDLATCLPCYVDESNFVVQQFIGFSDEEGREIYEGDFVSVNKYLEIPYKIEFRGIGFWFVDQQEDDCWVFAPNAYKLKVVGNIFENEDLLA